MAYRAGGELTMGYGALHRILDPTIREALRRYLVSLRRRTGTRWTVDRVWEDRWVRDRRYPPQARLIGIEANVRYRPERGRWEAVHQHSAGLSRLIRLTTGVDTHAAARKVRERRQQERRAASRKGGV